MKVEGLVGFSKKFIQNMKHEFKMNLKFQRNRILAGFAQNLSFWKDMCFYLTIILNFMILASYRGDNFEERL